MSEGPKKNALVAFLEAKQDALVAVLPADTLKIERFNNAVCAAVAQNDRLANAFKTNPTSFYMAVRKAAAMGLEPGDVFGHFYLVPFKNNKTGKVDTVAVTGYKGLLELARRHPFVAKINAHPVFEGEEFEYDRATDEISHPFSWDVERTDKTLKGTYVVATLVHPITKAREIVVHMMTRKEIDAVRKRSKSGTKKDGPWATDFQAMALKSGIRRAMNRGVVPMAAEVMQVLATDDAEEVKTVSAQIIEAEPAQITEDPMVHLDEQPPADAVDYNVVPELPPVEEPPAQEAKPKGKTKAAAGVAGVFRAAEMLGWSEKAVIAFCEKNFPKTKQLAKLSDLTDEQLELLLATMEKEMDAGGDPAPE